MEDYGVWLGIAFVDPGHSDTSFLSSLFVDCGSDIYHGNKNIPELCDFTLPRCSRFAKHKIFVALSSPCPPFSKPQLIVTTYETTDHLLHFPRLSTDSCRSK